MDNSSMLTLSGFAVYGLGILTGRLGKGGNEVGQIHRLNQKVDLLLKHFQLQPENQPVLEQCRQIALNQGKIEAIKYYRQATGAGLKEAKDEIDALGV